MKMKNEFIKIRISKKDKETLMKLSQKNKESISSYMLHKSLCENTASPINLAHQIDTINFINEIYHKINASADELLKAEVKALCNSYILNSERKEILK